MSYSNSQSRYFEQTELLDSLTVAKLVFTGGPLHGEEVDLQSGELTLGRSRKADVFLDDEKLSRIHAKISRTPAGFRLIDMNSRNGTYVNNVRVLEHPLSSFDVITIGNSKITFLILEISALAEESLVVTKSLVPMLGPAVQTLQGIEVVPAMKLDPRLPALVAAAILGGLVLFPKHDYSPTVSPVTAPGPVGVSVPRVPTAPAVKEMPEKIVEALKAATDDPKEDLAIYLEDGQAALDEKEYDRAADAFQQALTLEPDNETAKRGLELAEKKGVTAPSMDPEQEKRRLVAELFTKAANDLRERRYRSAIQTASKIREIELQGETTYLNEAKQILDRAQMQQREEFDPFLVRAKETYAEGNYSTTRDLTEEILKKDADYEEAKNLLTKAKEELTVLAKQAYDYGYVLESMNLKTEADQYYRRVFNYTREGDEYFAKAREKLKRLR